MSPTWNGDLGDPRAYGYTYSSTNGSLSGMTLPGGGAYSYNYDGLRRMNSRSLALNNSPFLTREYGYVPGTGTNDTTTLVGTLTNKKGNGTTLDGWTYTYDAAGQITSISDGTDIWSYTYDKQGQLLTETKGTGDDARTWTYSYDTGGNLRSVTTPGISITPIQPPWPRPTFEPMGDGDGEGDEEDDLAPLEISHTFTYSYGNAQWPDLLTAYNGYPITYDTSGNPTEWYDGAEMSWAHGRQLVSISATNDHAALSFSYDNSGLRLTKTVGTGANAVEHCYTWQGSKLIAEAFEDTELEFFYDESGAPYALLVRDTSTATPTESWYYYVTNLQGDVVMLLDASGNIAAEYSYNAWGEILSSAGTMADVNPIRYRGYYYDAETGLYYLQSRYYDPVVGRFINADGYSSTGQGILGANMFAYCLGNPISMRDDGGSDAIWINEGDSAGFFGHSGLIVQDENGRWWYFYWGPNTSSLNLYTKANIICGFDVDHGSYLIPIDLAEFDPKKSFEENVDFLQSSVKKALGVAGIPDEDRYLNLSSYYYFSGDYTNSYLAAEAATQSNEYYNLYSNNCLQKVLSILKESNPVFGAMGFGRSTLANLIPNLGYVVMKEEMGYYGN